MPCTKVMEKVFFTLKLFVIENIFKSSTTTISSASLRLSSVRQVTISCHAAKLIAVKTLNIISVLSIIWRSKSIWVCKILHRRHIWVTRNHWLRRSPIVKNRLSTLTIPQDSSNNLCVIIVQTLRTSHQKFQFLDSLLV